MNFNDLTTFVNIYETGSLNQSAIILGYAQSNLSVRLKTLESEMNTALFIRKILELYQQPQEINFINLRNLLLNNLKLSKKVWVHKRD